MRLWHTFKSLLSPRFFSITLFVAVSYIVFTVYITNFRIINQTIIGDYPFSYKSTLLFSLLQGFTTMFLPMDLLLVLAISLLIGINTFLLLKSLQIQKVTKSHVSFGGFAILGSTLFHGCCATPLLSVLIPSIGLSFLSFHGTSVRIVTLFVLAGSLLYSLYTLSKPKICKTR